MIQLLKGFRLKRFCNRGNDDQAIGEIAIERRKDLQKACNLA